MKKEEPDYTRKDMWEDIAAVWVIMPLAFICAIIALVLFHR
jgi:hypothetical protein